MIKEEHKSSRDALREKMQKKREEKEKKHKHHRRRQPKEGHKIDLGAILQGDFGKTRTMIGDADRPGTSDGNRPNSQAGDAVAEEENVFELFKSPQDSTAKVIENAHYSHLELYFKSSSLKPKKKLHGTTSERERKRQERRDERRKRIYEKEKLDMTGPHHAERPYTAEVDKDYGYNPSRWSIRVDSLENETCDGRCELLP